VNCYVLLRKVRGFINFHVILHMVKTLAQLQQVKEKEAFEHLEVKPEQKKVIYFIIKVEYVPKSSRKLNNKIKNE